MSSLCKTLKVCADCNGSGTLDIVTHKYRDGDVDEMNVDCENCLEGLVECSGDECHLCSALEDAIDAEKERRLKLAAGMSTVSA